jgi:hypothetical protein
MAKHPNPCRTGKTWYRDEIAAKVALARVERGADDRRERRAYRCHDCRGWHLTSRA